MEKLRIGLIGCGRISELHLKAYREIDGAEVAAVCDIDPALAESTASAYGIDLSFTDYKDLCSDPSIDAVEILTPQPLHEEMAVKAMAEGKHVSLQKPMTISLPSAGRILAAAEANKIVFRVADNYLFYPPIIKAKEMIDCGVIGEPTNIRIKMLSGGSGGWDVPDSAWAWRHKETKSGRGMQTFDHGHHLWALSWYLMGSVERVVSWIDSIDGCIDSPAVMMWKHRTGIRYGMCEYAHASEMEIPSSYYANDEMVEITGSKGLIMINRCTGRLMDRPPLSLFTGGKWTHIEDIETDWASGFTGSARNFVDAIRGTAAPSLSGEEGLEILSFDVAISESARLGREVHIHRLEQTTGAEA